jgi:hypothetical protein
MKPLRGTRPDPLGVSPHPQSDLSMSSSCPQVFPPGSSAENLGVGKVSRRVDNETISIDNPLEKEKMKNRKEIHLWQIQRR